MPFTFASSWGQTGILLMLGFTICYFVINLTDDWLNQGVMMTSVDSTSTLDANLFF